MSTAFPCTTNSTVLYAGFTTFLFHTLTKAQNTIRKSFYREKFYPGIPDDRFQFHKSKFSTHPSVPAPPSNTLFPPPDRSLFRFPPPSDHVSR